MSRAISNLLEQQRFVLIDELYLFGVVESEVERPRETANWLFDFTRIVIGSAPERC